MNWIDGISNAIRYIEENLNNDLQIEDIASKSYVSSFYFQKGFSMLCGFTVGEYIRQRRLTLAGSEIASTDNKIIDIAIKYGYDSPDSFTKAFTRFHGATPSAIRKNGAMIKSFAPLKIKFILEGGFIMDYKTVEKETFTVVGLSRRFTFNNSQKGIPTFWAEHFQTENGKKICGTYGICLDDSANGNAKDFEYLIADDYIKDSEIPDGAKTVTIPKHTWAVFPCKGAMPKALQDVNKKIFSEWLPNCKEYEISAHYNIEMYSNPCDLPKGTQDENYYSEIWIPVKGK